MKWKIIWREQQEMVNRLVTDNTERNFIQEMIWFYDEIGWEKMVDKDLEKLIQANLKDLHIEDTRSIAVYVTDGTSASIGSTDIPEGLFQHLKSIGTNILRLDI